jgi:energy-converting hydrogenase A subunit L
MNDQILYLVYILSFVIGSIVGLVLSYKKYTEPFVTRNIDLIALILAIIGWMLAINYPLLTMIPSYISITIGVFLIAMVIGMRPGYGRYETIIGFALAGLIWILRTVIL